MEFTITTTEDKENNTTEVEVKFEDNYSEPIKTTIKNRKNDVDTKGLIAREVFNIVKKVVEKRLSETLNEKWGYKLNHQGRNALQGKREVSEEQRQRERRNALNYYYRHKAQKSPTVVS
jgi:hypothetical protein